VAEAALDAGASAVNDVSAGRADPAMLDLIGRRGCEASLMHMQGAPSDMQRAPHYDDVVREVLAHLRSRVAAGLNAGIRLSKISVDPGIGFGKRLEDNLELIRALPELRQIVPDARLQLAVGANSRADEEKIEKWKGLADELDVGEHVNWLGYVEDTEMAEYYRAAPVFALPSRYEPFGMTAVEAMACGTPCVVTIHGGLEEMFDFGAHALFADPKRPIEYAVMLSMPLRYPQLRERLSIAGARFARRRFGWLSIAKRTLEVFERAKRMSDREPV